MEEITLIPETIQLIKMSDEEYFSDKYKDYISNSRLGLLEDGDIDAYNAGYVSKYSESFELGSAVHSIVLQPDAFFISDITKPTGKLGVFIDEIFLLRKNGYKIHEAIEKASITADYYSNSLSKTRLKTAIKNSIQYYIKRIKTSKDIYEKVPLYLSAPMKAKAEVCIENLLNNKDVLNLLKPKGMFEDPQVFNEYAIFCEVNVTIDDITRRIKIKGKLDNFTIDNEFKTITLNDLKTTGKPVGFFMGNYVKEIIDDVETKRWIDGSFQKYHYYRQMALYIWLLSAAVKTNFNIEGYSLKANMLLIETTPNYKSRVCKVNGKYIKKGLEEFKKLLVEVVRWTK